MIAAYISGRTGNQMFQYAFIRNMREKRGNSDSLVLNFNIVDSRAEESGYQDVLQYFNVVPYRVESSNLVLKYAGKTRLIYLFYKLCVDYLLFFRHTTTFWLRALEKRGVIFESNDNPICAVTRHSSKNIIVWGKFENSSYFDDIKELLRREFTPKHPILEKNKHFYKMLNMKNSICVHVRRGDYLSDEFRKDFYICDKSYYMRAIKYLKSHVDNPVFFFFSNDIDWVRDELTIEDEHYFEPDNNPLWETFRMMYSCKHFIISNSTFSWWAQYLSCNEQKIVISPDRWYNNPDWNSKAQLLEPYFIKIPTI